MSKEMFIATFQAFGRHSKLKLIDVGHVTSVTGLSSNVRDDPLWYLKVQSRTNLAPQLTISNDLQKSSDMYARSWMDNSWIDDSTQDNDNMKRLRENHQVRMSRVLQAMSVIRAANFNGCDPIQGHPTDCTAVGSRFFDVKPYSVEENIARRA